MDPYPPPVHFRCTVQVRRVWSANNEFRDVLCLETESGHYYELIRSFFRTRYGEVIFAHCLDSDHEKLVKKETPISVAIKTYTRTRVFELQGITDENYLKEISSIAFVRERGGHVNVIHSIEICSDNETIYSVMEFVECELYHIVASYDYIPESSVRFYFRQIVLAVQYLHSLPMCHRDISLENILVNSQGLCKIIDFGRSLRLVRDRDTGEILPIGRQSICGNSNYRAPEVLDRVSEFYPQKADIWSLGIVLFKLATNKMLIREPNWDNCRRYRNLCMNDWDSLLDELDVRYLSDSLFDLIRRILRPDPHARLSLEGILNHDFMAGPDGPHLQNRF